MPSSFFNNSDSSERYTSGNNTVKKIQLWGRRQVRALCTTSPHVQEIEFRALASEGRTHCFRGQPFWMRVIVVVLWSRSWISRPAKVTGGRLCWYISRYVVRRKWRILIESCNCMTTRQIFIWASISAVTYLSQLEPSCWECGLWDVLMCII